MLSSNFEYENYPNENADFLKKLLEVAVHTNRWDKSSSEQFSADGITRIKWLKLNILIEAFIKYHTLDKSNTDENGFNNIKIPLSEESVSILNFITNSGRKIDLDFVFYMDVAFKISESLPEIFPVFNFFPEEEHIKYLINYKRHSYLPDDLPYEILKGISLYTDSELKLLKLQYFCDLLSINFSTNIEQDNLHQFTSEYCHANIKLNWVNTCIIDSYLSSIIWKSLKLHYSRLFPLSPKLEYFPDPAEGGTLLLKKFTARYSGIYKWITLPTIALVVAFFNHPYIALLILWFFGVQIISRHYINKYKIKNYEFNDIYSENIEALIKLKRGLRNSVMHPAHMIKVLTKIDEYKIFDLDNLISFLYVIKNTEINPINLLSIGLVKSVENNN